MDYRIEVKIYEDRGWDRSKDERPGWQADMDDSNEDTEIAAQKFLLSSLELDQIRLPDDEMLQDRMRKCVEGVVQVTIDWIQARRILDAVEVGGDDDH